MPRKIVIPPSREARASLIAEYQNEVAKLGALRSALQGDFGAFSPKYIIHPGRNANGGPFLSYTHLMQVYGLNERDCLDASFIEGVHGWIEPEGIAHLFPFGIVRYGDFCPIPGQNGQIQKPILFQRLPIS